MRAAGDPSESADQQPRAGELVAPGSVVWFVAGGGPHLFVVNRGTPTPTTVPDLHGMTAREFFDWAGAHGVDWGAEATALPPSSKPHLWDNYRVATQDPAPGTRLELDEGSGFLDPVDVLLEPVS